MKFSGTMNKKKRQLDVTKSTRPTGVAEDLNSGLPRKKTPAGKSEKDSEAEMLIFGR